MPPLRHVARAILLMLLVGQAVSGDAQQASETGAPAGNSCLSCHADRRAGFSDEHAFATAACTVCHGGDSEELLPEAAHAGLVAFPGNLDNAAATCGTCHAEQVERIEHSLMHTGRGMVHTTRNVIDGDPGLHDTQTLQTLGDSVADSLLRKQCASCHLGQPKEAHAVDVTMDRGGGCLACHIASHPQGQHPQLQREVSTGRCFGCHSRSSRISLSYTGLAESEDGELLLADRRKVTRMPPDAHYRAGMGCTDCHGAQDIKEHRGPQTHKRAAVTAQCTDCHEPHADDARHERLTCSSCHSQWAAQCYGCHLEYEEAGEQWDHTLRAMTPGQWHDRAWDTRNTLPPLGVTEDNRVAPFVPGMVMTIAHPNWDAPRFFRLFAPMSPHTTGPSRSCESCHRSSVALGLGQGTLFLEDAGREAREEGAAAGAATGVATGVAGGSEAGATSRLRFVPDAPLLEDGLPADAWTNPERTLGGRAPRPGQRPFSTEEMLRIFRAKIQQDSLLAGGSGSASSASASNTGGSNSTSGRRAVSAPRSPTK